MLPAALAGRSAASSGRSGLELHLHRDAGHDQDLFDAPRETRDYFRRMLLARPDP